MEDHEIIDLYFARNEQAIMETDKRYGAACMRVSLNILNSRLDAEECVSDTYLRVWNSIPPQRPTYFRAFVLRIARNLSLQRFRNLHRQRRNRDLELALEELETCIVAPEDRSAELAEHISDFLEMQTKEDRLLFMGRYFHGCSVQELAEKCGMSANNASVRLHRIREKLRVFLSERGYDV
ncbi:MAG: sigma-70 family RNA polymerase sigma factor [Ruminococcaceae bacterium]|nr:sigma-70 family RNA polymerase sigma factor [Oscillospiraceae bacterium]